MPSLNIEAYLDISLTVAAAQEAIYENTSLITP